MAELKNVPAKSHEELLKNNPFSRCERDELLSLWDAMRFVYANGYIEEGSPLEAYRDRYKTLLGMQMIGMEQHLLQAIAVKYAQQS